MCTLNVENVRRERRRLRNLSTVDSVAQAIYNEGGQNVIFDPPPYAIVKIS